MSERRDRARLSLSLYYGAFFLLPGIYMPYLPLWMQERGISKEEIGLLLATASWTRVVANPIAGKIADRSGRSDRMICVLSAGLLGAFVLLAGTSTFWSILPVMLLIGIFMAPQAPLADSLASLLSTRLPGLDYARIRLWGSLTFIVSLLVGGSLFQRYSVDLVLYALITCAALAHLSTYTLPRPPSRLTDAPKPRLRTLIAIPHFRVFLIAGALLNASHSMLYGFGSVHLKSLGISESSIGQLWTVGVVAEIIFFALSKRFALHIRPHQLLLVAAAGGLLRWSAFAFTTSFAVFIPIQILHAATFACLHLGAIHYLREALPAEQNAGATNLYYALSGGVGMGIATPLSGFLYARFGGEAFLSMLAFSLLGGWLALRLGRGLSKAPPDITNR